MDVAAGSRALRASLSTDDHQTVTASVPERIQLFAVSATSPVRWRLLSGNNRELGRGLGSFLDAEECRIAIKELQSDMGGMLSRVRPVPPNAWTWELRRGGVPIAVSGHAFDRLIRCERGLAHFVERLGVAPIAETVMASDARRWMRGAR